jgi:2-succinyl-6-hydroxy-2,4-cyclohexadiene-1-carboxylate synthase
VALYRVNGVDLNVEDAGAGDPVVLLHGFTGSAESFKPIVELLTPGVRAISVDLLGHGKSAAPVDVSRYAFWQVVDDLANLIPAIGIERATWLGYSMGGRVALGLAIRHPRLVSGLVLESSSPGIEDPAERNQRRLADNELAARIECEGVASFVDFWEALPLWASQSTLPAEVLDRQRTIRRRNRASGLANSLRGIGTGAQPVLWDRLGEVTVPVLAIVGDLDVKFVETANRMIPRMPHASLESVPSAGHAVHLEQPECYARLVVTFLMNQHARLSASHQEKNLWT